MMCPREDWPDEKQADPAKHARTIVESCGPHAALLLARLYAQACPTSAYWAAVLAAVKLEVDKHQALPERKPPLRSQTTGDLTLKKSAG